MSLTGVFCLDASLCLIFSSALLQGVSLNLCEHSDIQSMAHVQSKTHTLKHVLDDVCRLSRKRAALSIVILRIEGSTHDPVGAPR